MCLILEVYKPLFRDDTLSILLVNLHGNDNRAGINLIGLFHILKFSVLFELAHRHQRQIHQADILVLSACKNFIADSKVIFICSLDWFRVIAVLKCDVLQFCGECRVAAVVGPVGIKHSDFRDCRVSVLLLLKIILDVLEVLERHGKPKRTIQISQRILVHIRQSFRHQRVPQTTARVSRASRALFPVNLQG